MKKLYQILPLLLVLILLLSACADSKTPPENTASGNTAESPPENTAGDSVTQKPPQTPAPPRVEDGVLIPAPDRELDAFEVSEKYERWYPETTLELIPRDDYGELFPFIGRWSRGYMMMFSSTYGLSTADGKIVCDAVYTNVKRYEHKGQAVYVLLTASGNSETGGEYCLAASDGSFADVYEEVLDGLDGTFTVKKNSRWGSVDYSGKEIIPCMYEHPIFWGEGLAAVTENFDAGYKYIDKQNKTVIGNLPPIPYERVDQRNYGGIEFAYQELFQDISFSNGRAIYYEGDSYGYIDTTGKIIALYHDDEGWFRGEKFIMDYAVVKDGFQYALVDKDMNIIFPFSESYISRFESDGEIIVSIYEGNTEKYFDIAGNEIVRNNEYGYHHTAEFGIVFVQNKDYNFSAIFKNGEEITIPESWSFCVINSDCIALMGPEGYEHDLLIDSSGNIIAEISFNGENYRFIEDYRFLLPREYATYGHDSMRMGVMTLDGEPVTEPVFEEIRRFGDYYAVYGYGVGGLLDKNGDWIVKLPFVGEID